MTELAAPAVTAPVPGTDGDWLSMHIFYTAGPNPLLAECVAPLVDRLRERGLVERWFFIRYWLEGPHTRLRLRPRVGADVAEVRALAEDAVSDFLRGRPAVYKVDPEYTADMYKQMFLSEYSEEEWNERYGPDGTMPIRPNNSFAYFPYEPEYNRYGGPAGVDLSEWHFEYSSDLVLTLVKSTNMHVRSVMFGLATQLMAVMTATFVPGPEQAAEFLAGYSSFWAALYRDTRTDWNSRFDAMYAEMAEPVRRRVGAICGAVWDGDSDALPGFAGGWAAHCARLRSRVVDLVDQRKLIFPLPDGSGPRRVTDPDQTLQVLLGSYLHMTNNRLGVTPNDESYLSHVLRRGLLDAAAEIRR